MATLTTDDRGLDGLQRAHDPAVPAPRGVPIVEPSGRGPMVCGGTDSWTVELDGAWVGWVGDDREWRGSGYGGRRWWACWRQHGDHAARWFGAGHRTQDDAVTALVRVARGGLR